MQTQVDNTTPGTKWEFDQDVTNSFDDMLSRSIPQYEVMRQAVFELGQKYIQRGKYINDLGASRGEAIAPFVDKFGAGNYYSLVEISRPMLDVLEERFKGLKSAGYVYINHTDLRKDYPPFPSCLTLCVLTLQFTPIEYRQNILQTAYDYTLPGGAFILVEKVLGNSAKMDKNIVDIYYDLKKKNGYTEEQIQRKRMSLEGVLVPVTAKWNEELLHNAGFSQVECFWRWMNFAAWIGVK